MISLKSSSAFHLFKLSIKSIPGFPVNEWKSCLAVWNCLSSFIFIQMFNLTRKIYTTKEFKRERERKRNYGHRGTQVQYNRLLSP